ncbi:GMC family oxidoreductase [Microbacterium sp. G2-8]|uniref:GMC family oxidoreductase n=1 Tax=Microbacterium sp. G2-8 TaxID=2842454 RepID=UPI001C8AB647|nr:GMC family oxidoreductase N-terminal domain-containing protein [Microbacterium sp. G2-8]
MIRTVVVGAGAAGIPLAVRLSDDPRRSVVLLEAGADGASDDAGLRDGSALRGADPAHAANWAHPAHLTASRPYAVARGRGVGGSTLINGGAFTLPRASDLAAWERAGGPAWSAEALTAVIDDITRDGPVRVAPTPQSNPASAAFLAACAERGFPAEPDRNAGRPPGAGPVPSTFAGGERVSIDRAYLTPEARRRLEVRGDQRALRIAFDGDRAVGVETDSGVIPADDVVLCAGALGSARLLLASGIGPAGHLDEVGVPVVADLPVGRAFDDHPSIAIDVRTTRPVGSADEPFALPTSLRAGALPDGDLEILLSVKPPAYLRTGAPGALQDPALQLLVTLHAARSRGTIALRSADPREDPAIDYGYLAHAEDLGRLRAGARLAVELLRADAFAGLVAEVDTSLIAALDDDRALDAWIRAHLGTALHTCGSAPLGAVVDSHGCVRGVRGLRVADTAILPRAPSRGPYAAAVVVGEHVARLLRAEP